MMLFAVNMTYEEKTATLPKGNDLLTVSLFKSNAPLAASGVLTARH